MKTLLLWITALVFLSGSVLFGQDLTGTWQGTLVPPNAAKGLRTVIKVTRADDNFKAVFYSIDQGGQPLPAGSFTVQGSTVKMALPAIGGSYEGKLSADGKSIAGSFTQGGGSIPLNLERATAETAWTIPEPPPPVKQMPADAKPAFEVATIKPSNPDMQGRGFTMRGREVITINTSLSDLIVFAYGLHQRQITGGAPWMESEKYDITGVPDVEGRPNLNQFRSMVEKLLADRFKLTFHHEKKELSVYALVVAKTGPKLTKNDSDPNGNPGLMFRGLGLLPARNATMEEFAGVMQSAVLDRPVVDQTGIKGRFDFTLQWTPDQSQFLSMGAKVPPPPEDAPNPDLFTAMQQQLGLKLEATKAPVDVIVIDRAERPSGN